MAKLVNRAKMSTATTGTGAITLGAAVDGYQSFVAAGVVDGDTVRYVIEDGSNWEIGTGVFNTMGGTLTRIVSESSNSGAAINLSGSAEVFLTAAAEDLSGGGGGALVHLETVECNDTFSAVEFDLPASYSSFLLILNEIRGTIYEHIGMRVADEYDDEEGEYIFLDNSYATYAETKYLHYSSSSSLTNSTTLSRFFLPFHREISSYLSITVGNDVFQFSGEGTLNEQVSPGQWYAGARFGGRIQTNGRVSRLRIYRLTGWESGTISLYGYGGAA